MFLATQRIGVLACDAQPAVRQRMMERYGVDSAADWQEALHHPDVRAVVVATPAPMHVEMATACLELGRHVLIEKPLSVSWSAVETLCTTQARSGRFAAVAYVLHFAPAVQAAREVIHSARFGCVRHVVVNGGQHFPFFRPAYREIYYRDRAEGGGAIQDALTHLANVVEWVVGPTTTVFCDAAHQVLDGVSVEDTVNLTARNGDVLVSYALNQFQAANETRWDFHAETGSVRVELHRQRWGTLSRGETDWQWHAAPVAEHDEIYAAQAHAFLDGCAGAMTPLCTLAEGVQTLRFNLAALRSWREKRIVTL